jgi:hypothetical protein
LRNKIVPAPPERATENSNEDAHQQGAPARISWTRLLKRVLDIDLEHCLTRNPRTPTKPHSYSTQLRLTGSARWRYFSAQKKGGLKILSMARSAE